MKSVLEEKQQAAREKMRKWRAANPQRVKEIQRKNRAKNPEKRREACKKWRKENPEKAKTATERWTKNNRERVNALSRKWWTANKEHKNRKRREKYHADRLNQQQMAREGRKQKKQKLVNMLGGKCVDCGYDKHLSALEFDHLYDKKFRISEHLRYNWKTVLNEIAKCELVCANCHRVRTDLRQNGF